jgi:potassium-transporting ATPase KdpC subunit
MKKNLLQTIRLTLVFLLLLSVIYPLFVKGISLFTPQKGEANSIQFNGNKQYLLLAQSFHSPNYFQPRPSATNYNAAGSAGSNKGPTNDEYLQLIQARIDTFIAQNPTVQLNEIPADLITASGSGLDPHISPASAHIQAARIAKSRNISIEKIHQLIEKNTSSPLVGLFGPTTVNVIELNIALDAINTNGK